MKAKTVCTLVSQLDFVFATAVLFVLALPVGAQEPSVTPLPPAEPPALIAPAAEVPVATTAVTNAAPKKLKTVVVTGSMISTSESVPIAPVIAITAEDIAKQGAATLSEVIKRLPQNRGSLDEKFQNGFAPGSAEVSLRGLGAKYTLVLLNGHRVAPYGYGQGISDAFADLNSLPSSAIERIEVLPEGASSIYGSDAIAGVVNIILKKDFQGTELDARWGNTFKNDMFEQNYSITSGFSDKKKKTSVMVNVEYYHRDSLGLKDRAISHTADQRANASDDFSSSLGPNPGYFYAPGGGSFVFSPVLGDNVDTPFAITPGGTRSPGDRGNDFDYNRYLNVTPEAQRYGALIIAQHRLSDNVELNLEMDYHNSWSRNIAAPTPIAGDSPPNLYGDPDGNLFVVPAQNPYNILGTDLTFHRRLLETGPRIDDVTSDTFRIVPGVNFHLANEWEAVASLNFNTEETRSKGYNYLNADAVYAALNSTDPATALNLFAPATNYAPGLANNPALIESLKANPRRTGQSTLIMAEVNANGPLFQLPAGKLRMAVGGDGRHESFKDDSDPLTLSERIVSSGLTQGKGHRDVGAIYTEFVIPIVGTDNARPGIRALEFDVSARFDQYSDFGNTVNPKFALKFSPHDDLVFRASYGTGFRAPSLRELYLGNSTSFESFKDPDPDLVAPPDYTNFVHEYRVLIGGDPELEAETSQNWAASVLYEPKFVPGLSLNFGWGRILAKKPISSFSGEFIAANYPSLTARNPVTGIITSVTNFWANFDSSEVEYTDMSAAYELPTSWGTFTFSSAFSWLYSSKLDGNEQAGSYNNPEWSGNGSIFWNYRRFTGGVSLNWIGAFDQNSEYTPAAGSQYTRWDVADYITMDLQATYEFPKDVTLTLGVRNVMDANPPHSASESEGYSLSYHDPVGRNWYLAVSKKF
ncbi:MAG: hypothetical protein RL380_1626 [Verrucomicrobiota bacterium]